MAMRPVRGYSDPNRYPQTENQARHLYRRRHELGIAAAFLVVGARVLFDPDKLDALFAERAPAVQDKVAP